MPRKVAVLLHKVAVYAPQSGRLCPAKWPFYSAKPAAVGRHLQKINDHIVSVKMI